VVTVDQGGDDDADQETSGRVDRERAPREDREAAALDQRVHSVAGDRAKGAADRDGEQNRHPNSFVRRSYQPVRRLKASPIARSHPTRVIAIDDASAYPGRMQIGRRTLRKQDA